MSYPMPQKSIGLLEEAYRMSKLDHPNIVKLIAVSKLSFQAFRPMIAMEWLPGGSLAEYFREHIRASTNSYQFLTAILICFGKKENNWSVSCFKWENSPRNYITAQFNV